MKQFFFSCILLSGSLFSAGVKAQYNYASFPNSEISILQQADSVKKDLTARGFVIIRESGLNMESQYESPIVLQLAEGCWYHLVFIGDMTSKLYEARMYDWEEKQVIFDQKRWGNIDGNILNYSYIPKFSEYHLLRLVQVNQQKKNLFGYAMIFKKVPEAAKGATKTENNGIKTR